MDKDRLIQVGKTMKYILFSISIWALSSANAQAQCDGNLYSKQQIAQDFTTLDKVLASNDTDGIKAIGASIEINQYLYVYIYI